MSPNGTFSSIPKKLTSGEKKNFFLIGPLFWALMGKHTEKSGKNLTKKVSGLGGLKLFSTNNYQNLLYSNFLVCEDTVMMINMILKLKF